ncbi:MAG: hypothetical protein AAF653_21760 [Chloroflexota bacterium]
MAYQIEWLDDQPVVIITMTSMRMHDLYSVFRAVAHHAGGQPTFVIYDCTRFDLTYREIEQWMQTQSMGMRGSITDSTTQTIIVGKSNALRDVVEAFERDDYGNVYVGMYGTLREAMNHARDGYRIFGAW